MSSETEKIRAWLQQHLLPRLRQNIHDVIENPSSDIRVQFRPFSMSTGSSGSSSATSSSVSATATPSQSMEGADHVQVLVANIRRHLQNSVAETELKNAIVLLRDQLRLLNR